ncbi:MAG: transporter [Alphaproteobacteria bacterium]|nr:transporter [Alphaproteobacteria bacterium]MBU0832712.1 transporter [Alphaproteobacteria bacterium]
MTYKDFKPLKSNSAKGWRCGLAAVVAGFGVALSNGTANAIDIAPGDYAVLPSGTFLGLTYFLYSSSDSLDINGDIASSELNTAVGLLRGVYYSEIGGVPVSAQAILPVGAITDASIGGTDQSISDGFGDLTLGFTVYPVNTQDPEYGTTIGLTTFVTAPTGNYDVNDISLGSGTWTITPQIGVIQGIGNGFFVDAAVDVAFKADHTEGGSKRSRHPSTEAQLYLRYQLNEKASVSFGYAGFFGGASETDGTETGLKTRSDQLRVFANAFVTPTVQVQGMLGTDLNAEGGFKQNISTQLRLLKVF